MAVRRAQPVKPAGVKPTGKAGMMEKEMLKKMSMPTQPTRKAQPMPRTTAPTPVRTAMPVKKTSTMPVMELQNSRKKAIKRKKLF